MDKYKRSQRLIFSLIVLLVGISGWGIAENDESWAEKPKITQAYEQALGKIYVEWEGSAKTYQLYVDGKQGASVTVPYALIDLQKGAHIIKVVPVHKQDGQNVNVGISALDKLGVDVNFNMSEMDTGVSSDPFSIDYFPNAIINAEVAAPIASIRSDNTVLLTFQDHYGSDEYLVEIKKGVDAGYIRFFPNDNSKSQYISKTGTSTTVYLDPDYLKTNGCIPLDVDTRYSFTVRLRKYAVSLIDGRKVSSIVHESKTSPELLFTPVYAWSVAPAITSVTQTGEGQIRLQWSHEPGEKIACEYKVYLINKVLGVNTTTTEIDTVSSREIIINDLLDGDYAYTIAPICDGKEGTRSSEVMASVRNTWNQAPELTLHQINTNGVQLECKVNQGVDYYRIKVYAGNNKSLLQFVDMDYREFREFSVTPTGDKLNTIFSYDEEYDPKDGVKLKFEIWAVRSTQNGTTQEGDKCSEVITLK